MDRDSLLAKLDQLPEEKRELLLDQIAAEIKATSPRNELGFIFGDRENLSQNDDRADRFGLVNVVARQIASLNSFKTYSINGPWGSGKSVFLEWLHKELKENHSNEVISVHFRAWKYQATQNLVYALIHQFKEEKKGKDFDKKVDHVLRWAGQISFLSLAAHTFGTPGVAWSTAFRQMCIDLFKPSRERQIIAALEELEKEFSELIEYVLGTYSSHPKKVVFLVDELDRCSIENVIVLLESIRNILQPNNDSKSHGAQVGTNQSPKVVFVFAIDKMVISQSIKMRYGNLPNLEGEDYLEKIIEFSFELPFDPVQVTQNIQKDFKRHFPTEFSLDFLDFAPGLIKTSGLRSIRTLKRIFSRFVVAIQLVNFRGRPTSYGPQILFTILFLSELYPKAFSVIRESGDLTLFTWIIGVEYQSNQTRDRPFFHQKLIEVTRGTSFKRVMSYLTTDNNGPKLNLEPAQLEPCMKLLELVGC